MNSKSKGLARRWAVPSVDGDVHAELVALMFRTMAPTVTVGALMVAMSVLVGWRADHGIAWAVAAAAASATGIRILCFVGFRKDAAPKRARLWERRYAFGTVMFAAVLATFGLYAFTRGDGDARLIAVTLVIGFCAGIVSRTAVRPWLAMMAVVTAATPVAIASAATLAPERIGVAICIVAMIVVSLDSVKHSYAISVDQIVTRRAFARQAAFDQLTGLANRTMLEERLASLLATGRSGVGVHFIDLDRFKQANDTHGHAAGDAVLRVVGERLGAIGHPIAFAARYGGDEFVVVQSPVARREEVARMGGALVDLMSTACWWNGKEIPIGASVGSIVVDRTQDDAAGAIAAADAAMIAAKRSGRTRAGRSPPEPAGPDDR